MGGYRFNSCTSRIFLIVIKVKFSKNEVLLKRGFLKNEKHGNFPKNRSKNRNKGRLLKKGNFRDVFQHRLAFDPHIYVICHPSCYKILEGSNPSESNQRTFLIKFLEKTNHIWPDRNIGLLTQRSR